MVTKVLIQELWPRLRHLARAPRRRAVIAVPFIGRSAVEQLPLRRGDILVTKFDENAVRQGLVAPDSIVQFIRRGVEVHTVRNLHAKVYVFGRVAIVGSANISSVSENNLVEVGCELTEPRLVSECRTFVQKLRGDVVELEFARRMIPLYRPPHGPFTPPPRGSRHAPRRKPIQQSELVAVSLRLIDYDESDDRAANAAEGTARKTMRDPALFRLENFRWVGNPPSVLRKYARVLVCLRSGNRIHVSAPARILEIRRYKSARGSGRSIFVTEVRKYAREKSLAEVIRAVGSAADVLRNVRGTRKLANPVLVYKLGQLWPTAASPAAA